MFGLDWFCDARFGLMIRMRSIHTKRTCPEQASEKAMCPTVSAREKPILRMECASTLLPEFSHFQKPILARSKFKHAKGSKVKGQSILPGSTLWLATPPFGGPGTQGVCFALYMEHTVCRKARETGRPFDGHLRSTMVVACVCVSDG